MLGVSGLARVSIVTMLNVISHDPLLAPEERDLDLNGVMVGTN